MLAGKIKNQVDEIWEAFWLSTWINNHRLKYFLHWLHKCLARLKAGLHLTMSIIRLWFDNLSKALFCSFK